MRQQQRDAATGSGGTATLIVLGGLPGTGKTTIAKRVAALGGAVYLRIDAIEQALRDSGTLSGDVGPAGYVVAYALASSNLALGRSIVADCVNPLEITRKAWRDVAARSAAPILEVEAVCPDVAEHRRRVEERVTDIPGLAPPTWAEVVSRAYEAWTGPRLVVDTTTDAEDAAAMILRAATGDYRVGTGDSPR